MAMFGGLFKELGAFYRFFMGLTPKEKGQLSKPTFPMDFLRRLGRSEGIMRHLMSPLVSRAAMIQLPNRPRQWSALMFTALSSSSADQ